MGAILVMYHYVRDPDATRHPGIAACIGRRLRGADRVPAPPLRAARAGRAARGGPRRDADPGRLRAHLRRRRRATTSTTPCPCSSATGSTGSSRRSALPYLQGHIPFVQKNQFVRGRLGRGRRAGRVPRGGGGGRAGGRRRRDRRHVADRRLPARLGEVPALQVRVEPADPARRLRARAWTVCSPSTSRPTRRRLHPRALPHDRRDRRARAGAGTRSPATRSRTRRCRSSTRPTRSARSARSQAGSAVCSASRSAGSTTPTATTTSARSASVERLGAGDRLLDAAADRLGLARRPLPRAARGHGVPADVAPTPSRS